MRRRVSRLCRTPSRTAMAVTMRMRVTVAVRHVLGRRDIDNVAVADSALGDDVIGERLHLAAVALQHGDLEAALLVEMYVQRRLRQVVLVVESLRQPLRQ